MANYAPNMVSRVSLRTCMLRFRRLQAGWYGSRGEFMRAMKTVATSTRRKEKKKASKPQ
jgi:hypothetical protein